MPPRYVKNRWTKKTILTPTFEIDGAIVEKSEKMDEKKILLTEVLSELHSTIDAIGGNTEQLKELVEVLKGQTKLYTSKNAVEASTSTKNDKIQNFLGSKPKDVQVHPPEHAVTKGRKKKGRIQGGKETSMKKAAKEQRTCKKCKQVGHNSRTCTKASNT